MQFPKQPIWGQQCRRFGRNAKRWQGAHRGLLQCGRRAGQQLSKWSFRGQRIRLSAPVGTRWDRSCRSSRPRSRTSSPIGRERKCLPGTRSPGLWQRRSVRWQRARLRACCKRRYRRLQAVTEWSSFCMRFWASSWSSCFLDCRALRRQRPLVRRRFERRSLAYPGWIGHGMLC